MKKDKQANNGRNDIQGSVGWLFLMAWRDSRRNRSRLALFISSVILGIAALVATLSFGYNLRDSIEAQAKEMVGADLVVESNRPLGPAMQALLDSPANRHSQEYSFASMVYFEKSGGSRLIQVRALDGEYPFYGALETEPAAAGLAFRKDRQALADKTLMLQFGAHVGDSIRIGELTFAIAGILDKAPGRNELSTTVAPPVYIPFRYLKEAGLLQKGSRIDYRLYYRYDSIADMEKWVDTIGPRLEKVGLRYETVESRKKKTGRAFDDFTRFLTLTGFIALLLGCIGVTGAIHIYIREKIRSVAILRCLGVKARQAFLIYLIQVAVIGLAGSLIGVAAGVGIQRILPGVFKDFLPFAITMTVSWRAIGQGMTVGLGMSVLSALLPLVSIRNISPLYTLRMSFEAAPLMRDPLQGVVYALILLFITGFSRWQMNSWGKALVFTGSILVALGVLAVMARLLMGLVRRSFPASWNYLWRQAFANLYRPKNQTLTLVVTIGLGAAFIGTLYFVQTILVDRVALTAGKSQGNMVLFDIQPGQQDSLAALAKHYQLPVLQMVPLVTMRVDSVRRRTPVDPAAPPPDSATIGTVKPNGGPPFRPGVNGRRNNISESELRVTYRDTLLSTEKLIAGKLGRPVKSPGEMPVVSLEEEYARHWQLSVGDTMVFDVEGVTLTAVVGSLRQFDWRRMLTNFSIVFPSGVLEAAPQFRILLTRVPSEEVSARFQRAVVQRYPNVSVIDLGLVLSVLEDILDKIAFVIRFMAGFSIITGIVVLIASVLISKYQRIQESVLLRTLGASRRQILFINALEYFFLGAFAAATGISLSLAGTWALAKYTFEASFSPQWGPVALLFGSISLLTMLIGLYNSRDVVRKPPLEILRSEA